MAKNQEGFFRSMGDIDVMEEIVSVGANVAGGVTAAWVMHAGLDKFTTKNPTTQVDEPVIKQEYRPWLVMTMGMLGRTFITNPQLASFFGGMATIAGAQGLVGAMWKDNKADYGFAGLGAANTDYTKQPDQVIETTANSFDEFDTITDAARNVALQQQTTETVTENKTTAVSGVTDKEEVLVN